MKVASLVSYPMLLVDLIFYFAISLTSMCSGIIISNTSLIFVFFLGLVLLREQFKVSKLLGVIVALESVFLIVLTDSHSNEKRSTIGNVVAFVDAFFVASYAILI